MKQIKNEAIYHAMLLPGIAVLFVFSIIPMFGVVIAFQDYSPAFGISGSAWIGLENFKYMFELPDSFQVLANTLAIAVLKLAANMVVPIVCALLLNEVWQTFFKRFSQTILYIPYFLSWVILASIIQSLADMNGPINQMIMAVGGEPVQFLTGNKWFVPILVVTDTWKGLGYNTVVYMATIISIDPGLYEAAEIDGASRIKQILYISLPGIAPTIVLLATLSLGNILNAGFDQVFNLYNPLVYDTGDIQGTYVFRVGLTQAQYGLATAVGMLKSVVSFILIIISNQLAQRFANYRIF